MVTWSAGAEPITERVSVYGSAPADQVTTYRYRDDGTLREVLVPDSSRNDASTVSYLYNFDSIGRSTEIIRPDAIDTLDRSRIRITYDGLSKTTSEVVGVAGGQPARTTTVGDRYGRLVRVDEEAGGTGLPLGWASTQYDYGPDDIVRQIIDPEGVTTHLAHDVDGRRIRIERAGRIWLYGYDKNGNVISQTVPGSSGTLTDEAFRSTTAYDDLDRVSSKSIGQRNLSAADQATFATATELFTWDSGPNHIGRLRFWKTFAPGSTAPAISIDLSNNVQGQRTRTQQTLNLAGYQNLTRRLERDYYVSGAPRTTHYHDEVASAASTSSLVTQDRRGLPSSIILSMTGQADQTIAVQTRNVAGLVTKRRTDVASAMGYVESNWTYDRLRRVTNQTVQKGPGATQVARQYLEYFGNDDPKLLDHWIGPTNRKRFEYRYDLQHQLVGVAESVVGAFSATYNYGPAGRFKHATEAALPLPGSDVKPRDVSYQYAGVDPEQLTSLLKPDGSAFASYEYDAAGNQTYRCEGVIRAATTGNAGSRKPAVCVGESLDMIYDGKDQLRRVVKRAGGARRDDEEYWYDSAGARVATVKHDSAPKKTELLWWLDDTEAHYDAAGALSFVYSHATLGTTAARVTRSSTTTSVEFQFHGLANNTLAAVERASGAVNVAFSYAPFGELVEAADVANSTAGVDVHRRRMNDKFVDETSELAYYGARYYDKTSMLWTQSDPLYRFAPDGAWAEPRRALLHGMSLNNPLRYLDPDGRQNVYEVFRTAVQNAPPVVAAVAAAPATIAAGTGTFAAVTGGGGGVAAAPIVGVASVALLGGLIVYQVYEGTIGDPSILVAPYLKKDSGTLKASPAPGDGSGSGSGSDEGTNEPPPPGEDGTTQLPPLPVSPGKGYRVPWWEKEGPLPKATARYVPKPKPKPKNNGGADERHKPADADGDGTVTDAEESAHLRRMQ